MRIGVLFSSENSDPGRQVIEALRKSGFQVRGFSTVSKPERHRDDSLLSSLEACDLPVFIVSPRESHGRLFLFAAGFFLGSRKNGFMYIPGQGLPPVRYFGPFVRVHDIDELVECLKRERRAWTRKREIRASRRELIRLGLCLNEESFASCASEGDLKSVENFLKAGFSINTRDRKGVPLLSLAVRNRHRGMVDLLLRNGADINAVSNDRENTALMDAASGGDPEILSDLILHGADLNIRSRNGQTALVLAIGNGDTRVARLLVDAGADTGIPDKLGMTAVKYAELFKHEEILKFLNRNAQKDYKPSDS